MRLRLAGEVTKNDHARMYRRWGYEVCCPEDIRRALEKIGDGEELILEINSGGGSVYAGFEMYSLLREWSGKKKAHIQSMAGSAMSVVVAACDEVWMSPVANMMIHRAATWANGNREVMVQTGEMLDTIDESILNAYTERVGEKVSREQLREMMEKETFFTAEKAMEVGFADGILPPGSGGEWGELTQAVAAMFHTLPPVEDLLQRKTAETEKEQPERKGETGMEVKNVEELEAAYPELVEQVRQESNAKAAKQERERILAIDEIAMEGFGTLVEAAKKDPTQTAETLAVAMIQEQKKMGARKLAELKADAEVANRVPGVTAEEEKKDPEETVKAAVENFYKEKGE